MIKKVKRYVPRTITLIHGDSHLGNFIATKSGKILVIDLDEMTFSDPNADLGKVIHEIDNLCYKAGYNRKEIEKLIKAVLETYSGENIKGVHLFRLRTPMIALKYEEKEAYNFIRYLVHKKSLF